MSISERAALAGPFIVSALLVFLAIPVGHLLIERVISIIREANARMHVESTSLPPQVTPEYIADYLDYAVDITASVSALVLVIAALVLVLIGDPNYWPTIVLAAVGIPAVIILIVVALKADPLTYNSRRRTRLQLSLQDAAVLLLNAAGIILVFTN
jgi:hypothetical protein